MAQALRLPTFEKNLKRIDREEKMEPKADYNVNLIKAQMGMANNLKGLSSLAKNAGTGEAADAKRWKASLDFQSMFLGQMYKAMRKSVMGSEVTEMSQGREIFTEMLDQEYARMDSKNPLESGSQGIRKAVSGMSNSLAAQIYRTLLRQEGAEIPGGPVEKRSDVAPMPFMPVGAMARALGGRKSQTMQTPALSKDVLDPIVDLAAQTYGVAKNLIRSVIGQESAGRHLAVSPVGAKGLMQLMDSTAREMGAADSFNPRENVMAGTRYLKQMLERFKGDEKLALAAYNAGPGAVDRFGGIPPYAETRNYVEKVLKSRNDMDVKDGQAGEAGAVRR